MRRVLQLMIMLSVCLYQNLSAQSGIAGKELDYWGNVTYATLMPCSREMTDSERLLKETLQMSAHDQFKLTRTERTSSGYDHQFFDQYYKGIPVMHGSYRVHGKNEQITTINGNFRKIENVDVRPRISESLALKKALEYVHAKSYNWEIPAKEKLIKEINNDVTATYYPKGSLVIKSLADHDECFRAAYQFQIAAHEPSSYETIYVDAINGSLIDRESASESMNQPGTGITKHSGPQAITVDLFTNFPNTYRLRETSRGSGQGIYTLNLQGQNIAPSNPTANGVDFFNGNDTFSYYGNDGAAVDIHWATEKVYDFWLNVFGRNSIDGNGKALFNWVHWSESGTPTSNGRYKQEGVYYGDGDGIYTSEYSTLDLVAHEWGHGINAYTSNVSSDAGIESQSINEGLSDLWAVTIENYYFPSDPDKHNWQLGEQVILHGAYSCLRNMGDPTDQNAKTRGPIYYDPSGPAWSTTDGHQNGLLLGYWFYLLTNGTSGSMTNQAGKCFSVTGIGIQQASRIVYEAQRGGYFSSQSNFGTARSATISAATAYYGANSNQVKQVTNAWYGLGVGTGSNSGPFPTAINGGAFCTSGNFSVTSPEWYGINWSSNQPQVTFSNSSIGTATAMHYNGLVTITATPYSCWGGPVSKNVWVGYPSAIINGLSTVNQNSYVTYNAAAYPGQPDFSVQEVQTYQWSFNPGGNGWDCGSCNSPYIGVSTGTTNTAIRLDVTNSCGTYTTELYVNVQTSNCGRNCLEPPMMNAYPNPSTGVINIAFKRHVKDEIFPSTDALTGINNVSLEGATSASAGTISDDEAPATGIVAPGVASITLRDENGTSVYQSSTADDISAISVEHLKNGTYYLIVKKEGRTFTNRVIVQNK